MAEINGKQFDLNNPAECQQYWTEFAAQHLVGKRVVDVRYLSISESREFRWHCRPLVLQFDDGSVVFPSRDDGGHDGGALLGQSRDREPLTFPVIR